jgi:putative transport protein
MRFLEGWASGSSVAAGLAILALAVTIGLALGAIRVRGVRLGISGVLFSALLFGQMGFTVDPKVLEFLRDFALILFMYAIGLSVGPAFASSLRAEGLRLNGLTVLVLALGALMTAAISGALPRESASGLYCGAFTTTPGFAAAQETLHLAHVGGTYGVASARAGLAYSITYPFGIIGPMLVIPLLRRIFGVKLEDERVALLAAEGKRRPPLEIADIEVTDSAQAGKELRELVRREAHGVVFSRMVRDKVLTVPTGQTLVQVGDLYRAVGTQARLDDVASVLGRRSTINLDHITGDVRRMDLVVTRTHVLHRPLRELDLIRRLGVTVVRVDRAGVELIAGASLRLAFADRVTVVGPLAGLKMAQTELGNCPERLNHAQLVPIFLGIVLGVIVGSIPLRVPGVHAALRIGLAGGPLLAAIALSQLGNVGAMVWYMPTAANQLFRDFGLAVFLACVGLEAGDHFIQRAAQGGGITLLVWGAVLTVVPVFAVGCFARVALRMNFITLAGWVAGAMGSTTTLLFVDEMTHSEAPAVAYAAVAPLATLVPIICAQLLAATVL